MKYCINIASSKWHRLKNTQQAELFKDYHLLYPDDSHLSQGVTTATQTQTHTMQAVKGLLIIDATWQESQKMMRQSPWLQSLPKLSLANMQSQYALRRNQSESGLCTLESLAHALDAMHCRHESEDLLQFFNIFQEAFLHARQTGQLNPRHL